MEPFGVSAPSGPRGPLTAALQQQAAAEALFNSKSDGFTYGPYGGGIGNQRDAPVLSKSPSDIVINGMDRSIEALNSLCDSLGQKVSMVMEVVPQGCEKYADPKQASTLPPLFNLINDRVVTLNNVIERLGLVINSIRI